MTDSGLQGALRNPRSRATLLYAVTALANEQDYADASHLLQDALNDVDHLLDPSVGGEPGDILLTDAEVAAASELWRAADRVAWPLDARSEPLTAIGSRLSLSLHHSCS